MSESILVTGGAGFIGSHLVDRLPAAYHRVTTPDNFNDFYTPATKPQSRRVHQDFENYRLVKDQGAFWTLAGRLHRSRTGRACELVSAAAKE